jgi:hypothetical protein
MEPEVSSPFSQEPADGSYPEPHASRLQFFIYFNIIFPSTPRSSEKFLPFTFSDQHFLYISHLSYACYMLSHFILLDIIILIMFCEAYKL